MRRGLRAAVVLLLSTWAALPTRGARAGTEPPYAEVLARARASDWPECVRLLEPVVRDGVQDPRVLSRYGLCLSMLGEAARAERVLRRCVNLHPGFEGCLNDLGAVLEDQGRSREARPFFERAAQLAVAHGHYSASFEWLVVEDLREGALESARVHLRTAWSLVQDDRRRAALEVLEARLCLLAGDGEGALRHLGTGVVRRHLPGLPLLRGLVLAWLGRFSEASSEIRLAGAHAASLPPGDAELVRIAPAVLAGTARRADVEALLHRFEDDQRAWFLAATAAHLAGRDREACRLLVRGRARVVGSRSLLRPPWATCGPGGENRRGGGDP